MNFFIYYKNKLINIHLIIIFLEYLTNSYYNHIFIFNFIPKALINNNYFFQILYVLLDFVKKKKKLII